MNQKGFSPVIISIVLAVIIGVSAIVYGYSIVGKNAKITKQIVELPPAELIPPPLPQAINKLGTPGCPDTDYTGCDTSSEWMTWDGGKTQSPGTTSEGIVYSK